MGALSVDLTTEEAGAFAARALRDARARYESVRLAELLMRCFVALQDEGIGPARETLEDESVWRLAEELTGWKRDP